MGANFLFNPRTRLKRPIKEVSETHTNLIFTISCISKYRRIRVITASSTWPIFYINSISTTYEILFNSQKRISSKCQKYRPTFTTPAHCLMFFIVFIIHKEKYAKIKNLSQFSSKSFIYSGPQSSF